MSFLRPMHAGIRWLRQDWHTNRYACFGAILLILTGVVETAYYLNYPTPELNADTPAYLNVVGRILAYPYMLVDVWRLPGYPLFVVLVYLIAGRGNLVAVEIVQAVFFALATLECYAIAILLWKRSWLAFVVGLLIGPNVILIEYVKPIMTEGMALWEITTLALLLLWFMRTMNVRVFWWMIACLILLLLTRPEWVYMPIMLFAYLLFVVWQKRNVHHWWRRLLLALALIYALVLAYVGVNGMTGGYFGLTAVVNFNLMGKVLQYHMQNEAPVQDAAVVHQLDNVIARLDTDPYHVLPYVPALSRNNDVPAGKFAENIILHHPVEFVLKSVPLCFVSLTAYYDASTAGPIRPIFTPLLWLKAVYRWLYGWNILFPLCALAWLLLLCWKRTRKAPIVMEMSLLVLLVLYGIVITTFGGYRLDDYMRFHIVFDPLLTVVLCGSLFMALYLGVEWLWDRAR